MVSELHLNKAITHKKKQWLGQRGRYGMGLEPTHSRLGSVRSLEASYYDSDNS